MTRPLSPGNMAGALAGINQWRLAPETPAHCPECGETGLRIGDHSTRPYAEWYTLACEHCGLDATINIPLGPPVMGGYE